jgi:hypothetical protein
MPKFQSETIMRTSNQLRVAPFLKSRTFVRAFLKVSRQLNFNRTEREMFLGLLLQRPTV